MLFLNILLPVKRNKVLCSHMSNFFSLALRSIIKIGTYFKTLSLCEYFINVYILGLKYSRKMACIPHLFDNWEEPNGFQIAKFILAETSIPFFYKSLVVSLRSFWYLSSVSYVSKMYFSHLS